MRVQRVVAFAALILAAGAAAATLVSAASSSSSSSLVTFVFGDSLTEVGNNKYLQYSLARSDYPWYGIDFAGGKATGRFTNGKTIGDIISAKLGIASPPPFLSLSRNDHSHLTRVNYASGGAGILNDTRLYFIQRLSFDDQINCFTKTKESIKDKIGEGAADKLCDAAMFFIGIGSNDYVNNFLQPFLADGQQYTHDEFLELLISTLDQQLKRLYALGARKMVFHRLGPLGCIPSQRVKSSKSMGAAIQFQDAYGDVMDLINNPTAYGFKISNTSCCNVSTSIGGLCLPNSKLCSNRSNYVFWDAFHPSDKANQVLADKLFSNLLSQQAPSIAPKAFSLILSQPNNKMFQWLMQMQTIQKLDLNGNSVLIYYTLDAY